MVVLVCALTVFNQTVYAADSQSKAIAMQIAEKQTQGKAVRAQYIEEGSRMGFRVRLLKEGKVVHKFVSMQQIKQQ